MMKGQKAFQKTNVLTVGPSFYPEDHQQRSSSIDQESVSYKPAAQKAHDEKSDNKRWKQYGKAKKKTNTA
jgi:hypothetical protein